MKREHISSVADLLEASGLSPAEQFELARFFARADDDMIEWFLHHVKVDPSWLTALSQNLRAKKALAQGLGSLTPQELWHKEEAFFQAQTA